VGVGWASPLRPESSDQAIKRAGDDGFWAMELFISANASDKTLSGVRMKVRTVAITRNEPHVALTGLTAQSRMV
jgi:hypothetical protein